MKWNRNFKKDYLEHFDHKELVRSKAYRGSIIYCLYIVYIYCVIQALT